MKRYIKEIVFPTVSVLLFGVAVGIILIIILEVLLMGGVG